MCRCNRNFLLLSCSTLFRLHWSMPSITFTHTHTHTHYRARAHMDHCTPNKTTHFSTTLYNSVGCLAAQLWSLPYPQPIAVLMSLQGFYFYSNFSLITLYCFIFNIPFAVSLLHKFARQSFFMLQCTQATSLTTHTHDNRAKQPSLALTPHNT